MAITWTVSHPERLITATAKVEVTAADIMYCADAFHRTGINAYRKLFDLTRLARTMSHTDMQVVGARMGVRATGQPFGAIAVVVASEAIGESAKVFQDAAAAERPIRIFRDLYAARDWLDAVAPPASIPLATAPQG